MFHHFHGAGHGASQGAISAEQLDRMIAYLGRKSFLSAEEWKERALDGSLSAGALCITFDDALKCQVDVALPVLEAHGLTAFWFVYTSVLEGNVEPLEIHRYFRHACFPDLDGFYAAFERAVLDSPHAARIAPLWVTFRPEAYFPECTFYTDNDRRFRFTRAALGPSAYNEIMDGLIAAARVDLTEVARNLWLDWSAVRRLRAGGHVIGLHSHTHPARLADLSPERQRWEYQTNARLLTEALGEPPDTMSHPCGSYTHDTLAILKQLGIRLGFFHSMARESFSDLEWPREDHSHIIRAMGNS